MSKLQIDRRHLIGSLVIGLLVIGVVLLLGIRSTGWTGASVEFAPVARGFFVQGLAHILAGWDHLAFVLCLALVSQGRQLAILVTCFTLGHSITLGLGFYGVVHAASAPVETAIALSIVYLAYEAFAVGRGAALLAFRRQVGLVSLFGLLHGLGFAGALAELDVPAGAELASLAFFNFGIEFGQLLFVGVVAGLLAAVRNLDMAAPARAAMACAVGLLGSFWAVERTLVALA